VRYRRTGWDGIFDLQEESRDLSQLLPTGVGVEKVRDRTVFSAAMIAADESTVGVVGRLRNRTSRLMFCATAARKNCSRTTGKREY
jgi:hypothetical protein